MNINSRHEQAYAKVYLKDDGNESLCYSSSDEGKMFLHLFLSLFLLEGEGYRLSPLYSHPGLSSLRGIYGSPALSHFSGGSSTANLHEPHLHRFSKVCRVLLH